MEMRLCLTLISNLEQECFLRKFPDLPQVRVIFLVSFLFSISIFRGYFRLNANNMKKNFKGAKQAVLRNFPSGK